MIEFLDRSGFQDCRLQFEAFSDLRFDKSGSQDCRLPGVFRLEVSASGLAQAFSGLQTSLTGGKGLDEEKDEQHGHRAGGLHRDGCRSCGRLWPGWQVTAWLG